MKLLQKSMRKVWKTVEKKIMNANFSRTQASKFTTILHTPIVNRIILINLPSENLFRNSWNVSILQFSEYKKWSLNANYLKTRKNTTFYWSNNYVILWTRLSVAERAVNIFSLSTFRLFQMKIIWVTLLLLVPQLFATQDIDEEFTHENVWKDPNDPTSGESPPASKRLLSVRNQVQKVN